MKKIILFGCILAFSTMTQLSFAEQPSVDPGPAQWGAEAKITNVTATVKAVDHKNRIITLEGPEGNMITTRVDDDVPNFKKVHKGNKVQIQYYEAMAWSLKETEKIPEPAKTVTTEVLTAKVKGKPMKVETQKVVLFAKVTGVDKKAETVTLLGPDGKSVTIQVNDPKNLEGVEKGEIVEITYTESAAFEVTKK